MVFLFCFLIFPLSLIHKKSQIKKTWQPAPHKMTFFWDISLPSFQLPSSPNKVVFLTSTSRLSDVSASQAPSRASLNLVTVAQCKESACQCRRYGFHPWIKKIPWRRKCQPTPVFLPGKSHGQRSLAGYVTKSWTRLRDKTTATTTIMRYLGY